MYSTNKNLWKFFFMQIKKLFRTQITPDKNQPTLKTKRLSEIPETTREFTYTPTYLKHVAGHEAVQYWMEKSKSDKNQDYKVRNFLKKKNF